MIAMRIGWSVGPQPRGDRRAEQCAHFYFVHIVDDLREHMRRLLEAGGRNRVQRVHVSVINDLIDDVKARRIGEHLPELAAGSRLWPREERHAVVLEVLHHDRLQLLAAADEPAARAHLIRSVERVADEERRHLRRMLTVDEQRRFRDRWLSGSF